MKLTSGADLLNYNLYTTAQKMTVWGDGTQGTATLSQSVGAGQPWNATVYGGMSPAQNVSVGTYGESLVVTINY